MAFPGIYEFAFLLCTAVAYGEECTQSSRVHALQQCIHTDTDAIELDTSFLQTNLLFQATRLSTPDYQMTIDSNRAAQSITLSKVLVSVFVAPLFLLVTFWAFAVFRSLNSSNYVDFEITPEGQAKLADTFPAILYHLAAGVQKDKLALRVWSEAKGIEEQMSFKELAQAVDAGAMSMAAGGVSVGDRVAFYCKGTLDFFIALLSVQTLGATPVLLNWRQSTENLKFMMQDSGVTFLMLGALHASRATLVQAMPNEVKMVLLIDGCLPGGSLCSGYEWSWRSKPKSNSSNMFEHLSAHDHCKNKEALVFFTSGSTSRPKPVLHTYETLIWAASNYTYPSGCSSTLCFLPNFHVIMTNHNFLFPLSRGICVSVHGADATEVITADMVLKAAEALSPTIIDTVPFIMEAWSRLSPEDLKPLSRCAHVQSGGAALPDAVAQSLLDAGVPVREQYGQTEAAGMQLATVSGAVAGETAVMMPPWAVSQVILDGDGDEGELIIQGIRSTAPGNLAQGALVPGSSKFETGVGHRTGDIFRWTRTRSGQPGLIHCSRTDDILLLSTGEMFNPVQMEKIMMSFCHGLEEQVLQAAVLGKGRPRPFLVVELSEESETDKNQMLQHLQPGLAMANAEQPEYAHIRAGHIIVLQPKCGDPCLPKTAKGNFMRSQCEQVLSELMDAAEASTAEQIQNDPLPVKSRSDAVIDSLGVTMKASSSTMREIMRVCDNVKCVAMLSIVIVHWYFVMPGNLEAFMSPLAQEVMSAFKLMAQPVYHYDRELSPGMCVVFYAFGVVDGLSDGPSRIITFLSSRTYALAIAYYFQKAFIRGAQAWLTLLSTQYSGEHISMASPSWALILMITTRFAVRSMQFLRMPPWLQLMLSVVLVAPGFFGIPDDLSFTLHQPLASIAKVFFDDNQGFYLCTSCEKGGLPSEKLGLGVCSCATTSSWEWWRNTAYPCAHLLGIYWGEAHMLWLIGMRRRLVHHITDFLKQQWKLQAERVLTATCCLMALVGSQIWVAASTPCLPGSISCALLYLFQLVLTMLLMLIAGIAMPCHCARIGGSTLGIYIFHRLFPLLFWMWVVMLVERLPPFSSIYLGLLQVAILSGWTFVFLYMTGPSMQQLTVGIATRLRLSLGDVDELGRK